jgi:hypothetical protein
VGGRLTGVGTVTTTSEVPMAGRVAAAVIGIALAMAAGGCAGPGTAQDGRARSAGAPTVHPRWESCDAAPHTTDRPLLPRWDGEFEPVAAVICGTDEQRRPGGGSDLVAVEQRADDVTALVAALRLPSVGPTEARSVGPTEVVCTADAPFVPAPFLLDAQGRWVQPGVPTDGCGKPRHEVRNAYHRLRTERVGTRLVQEEVKSDAAAASGCLQAWADMVWVTGRFGGGRDGVPDALPAGDAEVRLCVYRVPASEQGGEKPAGDFESGGALPAGRWTAIRREVSAAAAASPCRTPAARFAVVHLPMGEIYVEADGCRRVLIDGVSGSSALRQGTAHLMTLLFG